VKILDGSAGRYIRSNLKVGTDTGDASAANTFAIDIAGFYQSEEIAYNDLMVDGELVSIFKT
jgi:hypothetical protein